MSFETHHTRPLFLAAQACEVTLRYPLAWFAPNDDPLALRTLASPHERGPEFARFGGWPGTAADPQRTALATRFLMFWLLLGGDANDTELLTAVRGDDDPGDLLSDMHAWWESARRLRATMGPIWCARLGEHFAEWLTAHRCELRLASKLATNAPYPDRNDILPLRTAAVGVGPALDLLEYIHDCPLPHDVRMHPAFEAVNRYAARLLVLQCDLISASSDLTAHRPNLLLALLRGEGLAPAAALVEFEALHDESLCGLSGAAQWLRAEFSRCAELARWLRGVRTMCHSFPLWLSLGGATNLRLPDTGALTIEIDYI